MNVIFSLEGDARTLSSQLLAKTKDKRDEQGQ